MRYKITYKMEMTIDQRFAHGMPKNIVDKKIEIPLGETFEVSGTKENIKNKICSRIDKMAKMLDEWYYGESNDWKD